MAAVTLAQQFSSEISRGDALARQGCAEEAIAAYERAGGLIPGHSVPFSRASCLRLARMLGPAPAHMPAPAASARIQMTSLGANGRFGNQLLQYGFLRLYAAKHGLVAETPDWIGRYVFGCNDPGISAALPVVGENAVDLPAALRGDLDSPPRNCDLQGYFCGDTRRWGPVAAEFRRLYEPVPAIRHELDAALSRLRERGRTLVAIHLRRGDFGYGRFWIAPAPWYLDWLRGIWATLDRPVLYIASDEPGIAAVFAEFSPLVSRDLDAGLEPMPLLLDHFILSSADHLAISNSSFSFTAAMLNAHLSAAVRPDPERRALVEFNPWAAPVLMDEAAPASLATITTIAAIATGAEGSSLADRFAGKVGMGNAHLGERPAFMVASLYTPSYRSLAERLAASLNRLGVPFALFEVPTVHRSISAQGTDDPAYTKANFLRFLFDAYSVPVLYVDCDCVLRSEPRLIRCLVEAGTEFAIYNWLADAYTDAFVPVELRGADGQVVKPADRFYRFWYSIDAFSPTQLLCSGATQFYANTDASRALLDTWAAVIAEHPCVADDQCLDVAFNFRLAGERKPKALWLDKAYARYLFWIYARPVIDHPQIPAGKRQPTAPHVPLPAGPRYHLQLAEMRTDARLLPRDCLIDTQNKRLLRSQPSTARPGQVEAVDIGPLLPELYLGS
ncbi:MAG: alpha-1,2-fucosyltransferase [Steroidobacteraceae bacterium]